MSKLEFNLEAGVLHGVESITPTYSLYLGRESAHTGVSLALRAFGLKNAVAPGEWPDHIDGSLALRCSQGALELAMLEAFGRRPVVQNLELCGDGPSGEPLCQYESETL